MSEEWKNKLRKIEDDIFGISYHRLRLIIEKLCQQSPRLSSSELIYCFHFKLMSLKIMQEHTLEITDKLYETYVYEQKKDAKGLESFIPPKLGNYLYEDVAFFEAYHNAFYSFLQIIAKMTPYFFDRNLVEIPDTYFGEQRSYFIDHPKIDLELANYLKEHTKWYNTFRNNRNADTHNLSAYLWFDPRSVFFVDNPKNPNREALPLLLGKKAAFLEEYILDNWKHLLRFLVFYTNHFSNTPIFVDVKQELEGLKKFSQ